VRARVDVVVPTTRSDRVIALVAALERQATPLPGRIIVVDDTAHGLDLPRPAHGRITLVRGLARGPACARNTGWRRSTSEWVCFLDDDVVPAPRWSDALLADLARAGSDVGGVQGRVLVPLPAGRRPTDAERGTCALQAARWATADMAYRRVALTACGGFDERFQHAYREDADLALRVRRHGYRLVTGSRRVAHPPHRETAWASARRQRGNADDALMRRLHGPTWRELAGAPRGHLRRHAAVAAAGLASMAAATAGRDAAGPLAVAWVTGTAAFAAERLAAGPGTAVETAAMAATSAAIPPLAVGHRLLGAVRARRLARRPQAVLFDRDGTLIEDVPANRDPALVRPLPGARHALDRLRSAGIPVAIVTNQAAVGEGRVTAADVLAINDRVEQLLGPFAVTVVCPHRPDEGCDCRKPQPAMPRRAARALGVSPAACAMVGDTAADVEAGRRAGARAMLVPNARTRRREILAAPEVASDLPSAVTVLLEAGA
jgi:histidinol-phosphate phosphatase family protein